MTRAHEFDRKSGFATHENRKRSLNFSADPLGQPWPRDWPSPSGDAPHSSRNGDDPLGEPLGLREVAKLIGCSPWTVRQRYLPAGLPHFRSGPNAKLIFYKNQVIRWLLRQQEKGGTNL